MRLGILTSTLLAAAPVFAATAADSLAVAQKSAAEATGFAGFAALPFTNPAVRPLQRGYSYSQARLGYSSQLQTRAATIEKGRGEQKGFFAADAFIHSGSSTVWGSAAYHNGRILGMNLCESPDYDKVYPYVIADTIGGNQSLERYMFSGGYARSGEAVSWGVSLGYVAGLYYRQVDPRPKTISGQLNIAAGVTFRIGGYDLGPALLFERYRQSTGISFVSEMGDSKLYHLTGLGTDYARFAGSGANVFSDGYTYSLGADLYPRSGSGAFASARFSLMTMRHVVSDLNKLPLGNVNHRAADFQAGYVYASGSRWRWKAMAEGGIYRRHGKENLFGDATSGSYPQIGSRLAFADNAWRLAAGGVAEYSAGSCRLALTPKVGFQHRLMSYIAGREWLQDGMTVSADFSMAWSPAQRWVYKFRLAGMLYDPTSSGLKSGTGGSDRESQLFAAALKEDFRNATCTRRTLSAALAGEYAISAKYAVGIDVTYRHENYASGVIGNGIEAAVSFIF